MIIINNVLKQIMSLVFGQETFTVYPLFVLVCLKNAFLLAGCLISRYSKDIEYSNQMLIHILL